MSSPFSFILYSSYSHQKTLLLLWVWWRLRFGFMWVIALQHDDNKRNYAYVFSTTVLRLFHDFTTTVLRPFCDYSMTLPTTLPHHSRLQSKQLNLSMKALNTSFDCYNGYDFAPANRMYIYNALLVLLFFWQGIRCWLTSLGGSVDHRYMSRVFGSDFLWWSICWSMGLTSINGMNIISHLWTTLGVLRRMWWSV